MFTGQGKTLKCLNVADNFGLLLLELRVSQSCFPQIETVGISDILTCVSPSQM